MTINTETVKFIGILTNLASRTAVGFRDFHSLNAPNFSSYEGITYDSKNKKVIKILSEVSNEEEAIYKIDSFFDDDKPYTIEVCQSDDEESNYYILVTLENNQKFIIENGYWYAVQE